MTSPLHAHRIWITAEKIKRVTDRLIGWGPFGIGLDGFLAFTPLAGTAYCVGAGIWLVAEGIDARASAWTLTRMGLYVGVRSLSSVIPFVGPLIDIFFRGHMLAAGALQKDIARRFGAPPAQAIDEARRRPFAPRAPLNEPVSAS